MTGGSEVWAGEAADGWISLPRQADSLPSPLTPWPRAVLHSWPKIHNTYVKLPLLFFFFFFLLETYFLSAWRENCYWYAENSLLSYSVVTWQPTLVLVPAAGGQHSSVAQRQRGCLPRAGEARRLPFSPIAMHALCGLRAFVAILELVAEWCLALAKTQEK